MELSTQEATVKAFELAYFIHPRRNLALGITSEALCSLQAQLKPQQKRAYYSLRGRLSGGISVRARTKITLEASQKLQSLVYAYSERLEKQQEEAFFSAGLDRSSAQPSGMISEDDLLVRFIKHLVAITVKRSSFYVTLGVSRIVSNYSTEEAVKIYDALIQDSCRMKDAPYFRKRKNEVLMKETRERFGKLLQTQTVAHGEERFTCRSDVGGFAPLVRQCLDLFTPWNTDCILPERLNPMDEPVDELTFKDEDPDKEHLFEARRMHTLLHPGCFARFTSALGLAAPDERLEVPIFFFSQEGDGNQSGGGTPSGGKSGLESDRLRPAPLRKEELSAIEVALQRQNKRRLGARPEAVLIMIDGVKRETIKANQASVTVRVDEDARLIEVKSIDKEGELLLASLLLDHRELRAAIPSRQYRLGLGRSQELSLTLSTIFDGQGAINGADLTVAFRKVRPESVIADLAETIKQRASVLGRPLWAFSTLAIVLIAAAIGITWYRRQANPVQYVAQVQSQSSKDSNGSQENGKSQQASQLPVPTITPHSGIDSNKVPKTNEGTREGTRSLPGQAAVELSAIKRVYVEEHPLDSDRSVRNAFVEAIASSDRLTTTTRESDADALLVWRVRRVGSTERFEVRLMSRSGQSLWSASRVVRRGEDKSVVATRIARELVGKIFNE